MRCQRQHDCWLAADCRVRLQHARCRPGKPRSPSCQGHSRARRIRLSSICVLSGWVLKYRRYFKVRDSAVFRRAFFSLLAVCRLWLHMATTDGPWKQATGLETTKGVFKGEVKVGGLATIQGRTAAADRVETQEKAAAYERLGEAGAQCLRRQAGEEHATGVVRALSRCLGRWRGSTRRARDAG